jgi:TPR repeat protein
MRHRYADGHGVGRDVDEAKRLWLLAANQGHPNACWAIAQQYRRGMNGMLAIGFRWLFRAAGGGDERALELKRMAFPNGEESESGDSDMSVSDYSSSEVP